MDAWHLLSLLAGAGLLVCAALLGRRAFNQRDQFLKALALACILLATTQIAMAVPGWLRGEAGWIFIPRLAGLVLILWQLIRLRLAR